MRDRFCWLGEWDLFNILTSPMQLDGGAYAVSQEGLLDLETTNELGEAKGASMKFEVTFYNDPYQASRFRAYCAANKSEVDLKLYEKDAGWYYRVWGIILTKLEPPSGPGGRLVDKYEVRCILYSPYCYATVGTSWKGTDVSLPQVKALNNNEGHYDDTLENLEITCKYDSGHVKALTLTNAAGDAVVITDEALTDEVWEIDRKNKLYETYEDTFASGTKHGNDTTGDGTFDTDHIELDNGEYCVYHLAGPNWSEYPVIMTLEATLDAGGATGEAYVEVSSGGVTYYEAFDQSEFGSGKVEHALQDAAYMKDIDVKIRCNSGTAGKKVNISYIKFYVRRRIEDGELPVVEAGKTSNFTLSCNEAYGDQVTIDGTFRPRRYLG